MAVEDHPLEYARFEGVIPAGEYGGGTVMIWDIGTWELLEGAFGEGAVKFEVRGKKLHGAWRLVRTRGQQWLLIKSRDASASSDDITTSTARSSCSITRASRDSSFSSAAAPAGRWCSPSSTSWSSTDVRFCGSL